VIYIFTSVAKMDRQWCAGYTIHQVGQVTQVLRPFVTMAERIGVPAEWFWSAAASAVIPLELFISVSYFLAVRQDEPDRLWTRRWCLAGWIAATGLHLNNELMHLSIQWFSYYMIFLAGFFLSPIGVLQRLAMVVIWPVYAGEKWLDGWSSRCAPGDGRRAVLGGVTATGVSLAAAVWLLDLPGALWATVAAGGVVLVLAIWLVYSANQRAALRLLLAVAAAGCLIQLMALFSLVRFDYYDLLGRTVQRLGTPDPTRSGVNDDREFQARFDRQRQALAAFHQALKYVGPQDPRRALVYNNMGLACRHLGEYHRATGQEHEGDQYYRLAVKYYRQAVRSEPSNPLPRYNLGVTYQFLGETEQALACYGQALQLKPDLSDAMLNIGMIREQQGDFQAALRYYQAARQVEPHAVDIREHIRRVTTRLDR
jgi:hypothetical protein